MGKYKVNDHSFYAPHFIIDFCLKHRIGADYVRYDLYSGLKFLPVRKGFSQHFGIPISENLCLLNNHYFRYMSTFLKFGLNSRPALALNSFSVRTDPGLVKNKVKRVLRVPYSAAFFGSCIRSDLGVSFWLL